MSSRTAAGRRRMQNMPQKRQQLPLPPPPIADTNKAISAPSSFFQSKRSGGSGSKPQQQQQAVSSTITTTSAAPAPYPSPPADTVPLPLTSIISDPSSSTYPHSPVPDTIQEISDVENQDEEDDDDDEMGKGNNTPGSKPKKSSGPSSTFFMVNAATFPVAYYPPPASPKPSSTSAASVSSADSKDSKPKLIYQHPNAGSNSSMNSGNTTSTTRTRIRFRSKKSKSKSDKKNDKSVDEAPPLPPSESQSVEPANTTDRLPHHALPRRPSQTSLNSDRIVSSAYRPTSFASSSSSSPRRPADTLPPPTSHIPPHTRAISSSASSSSSSSGSKHQYGLGPADTPFVFPSSRSRAHPSPSKTKPLHISSPLTSRMGKAFSPPSPTTPTITSNNTGQGSHEDPFGAMAKAYFGGLRGNNNNNANQAHRTSLPPPPPPSVPVQHQLKERPKISGPVHLLPSPVAPEVVGEDSKSRGRSGGSGGSGERSDVGRGGAADRRPVVNRVGKVGVYPLDPYDPILLEGDRHTHKLLNHMLPSPSTCPTFHQFGNTPPSSILDLGCGTGTWLLEAAETWRGYGTQVTGVDMVDVTKDLRGRAKVLGVENNVSFVRVNFMKKKLPFPTESFDLVRLSCLTYCVAFEKWEWVLSEVKRVLNVGGRVEIIDDHVFFPYGKAPSSSSPSSATANQLYKVPEEGTAGTSTSGHSMIASPEPPDPYYVSLESGKQLESLFENLVNTRFGIHLCPSEFLPGMLEKMFGWQIELGTWHWTLTFATSDDDKVEREGERKEGMDRVKGMTMWPDTFVPMSTSEVEHHAFRQPRMLLSMKTLLSSYAVELHREDRDGMEEDEMDETDVMEALWEYDGFLQNRFFPPRSSPSTSRNARSSRPGSLRTSTRRNSVMTMSSVSEEAKEAMWEYESDVRNHFGWDIQEEDSHSQHVRDVSEDVPVSEPVEEEPVHVRTFHVYEAIKMPS